MTPHCLKVAVPWSLSHYIPLNGFHPLYRALFDYVPDTVVLSSWDNAKLYRRFRSDSSLRNLLLKKAEEEMSRSWQATKDSIEKKYFEYFWAPNQILTTELMGDIEFHHTAPFPSLKRPFVFHCESFAPVLFPFTQQGSGDIKETAAIREHYRTILADPLCLGIFSHIPETLETFKVFFSDPAINCKLFPSTIGLSENAFDGFDQVEKPPLSRPRFLFVNSANQNSSNFFRRGGHLVLRFWKEFLASGRHGLLVMRCSRPSDDDLIEYGVDISMISIEMGESIIWAEDYLANHEMNALMASSHFFLLPSASLHSASIMQSMALGTIPVVSDTVGTSVYISDNENGIILQGIRRAVWHIDEGTGILVDAYCRTPELDISLVTQLFSRVCTLLDNPSIYWGMQTRTLSHACERFSGQSFAKEFWSSISELYAGCPSQETLMGDDSDSMGELMHTCRLERVDWSRTFESPTQPMLRIDTGRSRVWEVGGAMIHGYGFFGMGLNDWSVFAQFFRADASQTTFANTLEELRGKYLRPNDSRLGEASLQLVGGVSRILKPFPRLYRFVSYIYSLLRRYGAWRFFRAKADPDVELVKHGVSGYNIIRNMDGYHAILQKEGDFIPEKIEAGGYSSYFFGQSLDQVLSDIADSIPSPMFFDLEDHTSEKVELVLESFRGFNIFHQGNRFYAIPEKEGECEQANLSGNRDNHSFSGLSIESVKREILSAGHSQ